ncbi:large conductance mechanosensitive channel protein MscL, partial [Candidatus Saccharibacteria bacterium]|nr:large conductance mechanosensitive channel protein MscL [Candidatus Saccharibacteria bacterium]
ILGNTDFSNLFITLQEGTPPGPYAALADAQAAGAATINYGLFTNTIISFIVVALAMFLLIRSINRLQRREEAPPAEPTTKTCPFCFSEIAIKATRCPNCTSELTTAPSG